VIPVARELLLYWAAGADQNRYLKSSKLYYKQYICHHMYVYVISVRHRKWAVGLRTHKSLSQWSYIHVSVKLCKALVT